MAHLSREADDVDAPASLPDGDEPADLAAVIEKLQRRVADLQRVPQPAWRRFVLRPRGARRPDAGR